MRKQVRGGLVARENRALTLLELIIIFTVCAILVAVVVFARTGVSVPSAQGSIDQVSLSSGSGTLVGSWEQTIGGSTRYFVMKAGSDSCTVKASGPKPYHCVISGLDEGKVYKVEIWGMGKSGQSTKMWTNYSLVS